MNITDLIVELLEKGQKVEMPGIGTLDTVVRSAHHDPNTRTYYPASRAIAFSAETTGDNEIVKVLAERECVSEDVAKQMWLNYIDALTDKVKRSGHHNFGRLGTLNCDDKRTFSFKMTEGLVLNADNKGEIPIEEVKIYNHEGEEDPFARFDEAEAETAAPAAAPAEEPQVEAEPAHEEVTAPEPEPEPEPAHEESHWDESLKKLEDMEQEKTAPDPKAEARAEKERIKSEKKAEIERLKLEKKAAEEKRQEEELQAKQRKDAERREIEGKRKAAEELRKAEKRAEEERIKAEKKAEAGRKKAEKEAEKERIKAEKKAAALAALTARENAKAEAAARSDAEKEAAKQAALQAAQEAKERKQAEKEAARLEKEHRKEEAAKAKAEAKERKQAEKEAAKQAKKNKELADNQTTQPTEEKQDHDEKKRSVWPIVLILLCLLLVGGGAYYLLKGNKSAAPATTAKSTHIHTGAVNAFTYNPDMINYSGREIAQQSDLVCRFMSDYISQYLADRNFSGARAPMMDRIRQYANERLSQMLGDRFAVQRLIPYNDYIYNYNEPFMKGRYARSCRGKVQMELMNYRSLDDMLYRLADELGLQPGGAGHKTAAEVQQVKADEKKAIERRRQQAQNGEAPMYVYVEKGSKLGYDIIAGFYLNKSTAAKLTARLHEMGCDAYIIEFSDMYYVSMGSASTQTAADALYKHIKSWYDGDVVIKKW